MLLEADNDINLRSTTRNSQQRAGASSFSRTNIDRVAGLYVSNPDAVLVASAGNDVNLMAASIVNSGSGGHTQISAGQDINLGTVQIAEQNSSVRNSKNYVKHGGSQEIGSSIEAMGDLAFNAGNDLNAKAATVSSESGAINASAGQDINIVAGRETSNFDTARKVKKSGTFSSSTKSSRDTFNADNSVASTFSGDTVTFQSGSDIKISGSNVVSDNGTALIAGNNINIVAAEDSASEFHERKTKKSGFSASGASVSYGTQKLDTKQTSNSITHSGSTVGSVHGDASLIAGKNYTQTASDVIAPEGNVNITAQRVDINAAENSNISTQETKFKQSGITLAISNPVIDAIQTVEQLKQAASETNDSRMQALAAGTAALAASNAYDMVQAGQAQLPTGNGALDAINQVGGINISLSIGSSKSSSMSTQTSSQAQGSQIAAGNDINISATGAGMNSDINVLGSTIGAGNNVALSAEDQINLLAAKNTASQYSKNKSSSTSVGVSFGTSGFAVTASASKGRGNADGNDVSWTESIVQGGNQVNLESGTDTNLIGAQARGNQVIVNVGISGAGSLNIQSLQDTSTYDSKQKSTGLSVSVPIGAGNFGGSLSASKSNINSDYASVVEQSGIYAGDDGFQVNVSGNTNLKGAVIASTEQAMNDNKNRLTTETLTTHDIQNSAEYEGKATSATVGGGIEQGLPTLSGTGIGSDSDKADSITVSGISAGVVSVIDDAAQLAKTGRDAVTIVALLNQDMVINDDGEAVDSKGNITAATIVPIFDKEKIEREIQAQARITQAFSQQAPKALTTFATKKVRPYQDAKDYELIKSRQDKNIILSSYEVNRLAELEAAGMTLEHAQATLNDEQAKADYENWNGNGNYRVAANIIVAAIGGSSSGAITAVTKESLSWAADQMRQFMIEGSREFKGLCVSETDCISNRSGTSVGVNGSNEKLAGGRLVLEDWCKKGGENACERDTNTISGYKENPNGTVIFNPRDDQGNKLTISQFIENNPILRSPLGGHQGAQGQMKLFGIQFDYEIGSFWDRLAEVYAGPHDTLNSFIWYDNLGNGTKIDDVFLRNIGDITNITNVAVATPFALGVLLPPEIWNAVVSTINQ